MKIERDLDHTSDGAVDDCAILELHRDGLATELHKEPDELHFAVFLALPLPSTLNTPITKGHVSSPLSIQLKSPRNDDRGGGMQMLNAYPNRPRPTGENLSRLTDGVLARTDGVLNREDGGYIVADAMRDGDGICRFRAYLARSSVRAFSRACFSRSRGELHS